MVKAIRGSRSAFAFTAGLVALTVLGGMGAAGALPTPAQATMVHAAHLIGVEMPGPGNSHAQTEIRLPAANQPVHEAHETTPEPGEIEHGLSGVAPEHALEAGDNGSHRGRGTELEHASGDGATDGSTGKGGGGEGSGGHH